jgi:hydroxymethylbilane synthase
MPWRPIDPRICLPAVGQGALAIETRADDARVRRLVASLDHAPSHDAVRAERAFLAELGGGCLAPATGFARVESGGLTIEAVVGDPDGIRLLRDEERGGRDEGETLGRRLARRMLAAGAAAMLEAARIASRPGREPV